MRGSSSRVDVYAWLVPERKSRFPVGVGARPPPVHPKSGGEIEAAVAGSLPTLAAQKPGEVTTERLRNADKEPENWLHYGGTYRSLRYSALDKINAKNVSSLQAAWAFNMGTTEWGYQATPLVADGVMYAIGTNHRVFAIDAATGAEKWRYFYEKKSPAASVSRGCQLVSVP